MGLKRKKVSNSKSCQLALSEPPQGGENSQPLRPGVFCRHPPCRFPALPLLPPLREGELENVPANGFEQTVRQPPLEENRRRQKAPNKTPIRGKEKTPDNAAKLSPSRKRKIARQCGQSFSFAEKKETLITPIFYTLYIPNIKKLVKYFIPQNRPKMTLKVPPSQDAARGMRMLRPYAYLACPMPRAKSHRVGTSAMGRRVGASFSRRRSISAPSPLSPPTHRT